MRLVSAFVALAFLCAPAGAQWLNYKTPGIPRTADGKPDLKAPAPKMPDGKPDFSGVWRADTSGAAETGKAIMAIKPQPWAATLAKARQDNLGREDMSVLCLPFGPRVGAGVGKVLQTQNELVMLREDLTYRQVFLDGRELPKDPNPAWMGYSIGHWDGDSLVIESNGYNDRTWLDGQGHPHTEDLRVTERLRRPDFGHLEVVVRLEDPKAFTEPWTIPIKLELDADTEPMEYVCAENERDRQHLIGKASDESTKEIKLSADVLKRYVGAYEFHPPDRPDLTIALHVGLDTDHLVLDQNGGPKMPANAVTETKFFLPAGGVHFEFIQDDKGVFSNMVVQIVEGEIKAVRKQ